MSSSEGLGYGTQISLTGAYADADVLADRDALKAVLKSMVTEVEGPPQECDEATQCAVFDAGADGISACVVRGETVAEVHTFPALRVVSLRLFSAHDISLNTTTRMFLEAYSVGRFESSVRAYGRYPQRDERALEQVLAGEREYARLLVTPQPTVTI